MLLLIHFFSTLRIPKVTAVVFLVLSIIIILYYLTSIFHTPVNSEYSSYLIVLIGQMLPFLSFASWLSWSDKYNCLPKVKQLAYPVAIIFCLVSLYTVFYSIILNGERIQTNYYLNYQNTAYMAAYSAGLMLYSYIFYDYKMKKSKFFVSIIVLLADLFTVLVSGGRGGLLSYIVSVFLLLVILAFENKKTIKAIIKTFLGTAILFVGGYYILKIVSSDSFVYSGFQRIIDAIVNNDSSGRDVIWKNAFLFYKESPIVGHGFGSVLSHFGYHCHNLIIDSLVEIGLFGTGIIVVLLISCAAKLISLVKTDSTDAFWLFIFVFGLTMSLFSGYYLTQFHLWWIVSFVFSKRNNIGEYNG